MYVGSLRFYRLSIALALALASSAALGQSTTGSIFGDVSPGEGDSIVLSNTSGFTREIKVDDKGHFSSSQIPVGIYKIILKNGGQTVATQDNVQVRVASGSEVAFAAPAAAGATTLSAVSVTARAQSSIDVTSVDSRTVITSQELARLPLARSAEAVALLAPGVVNNSGGFTSPTGQSLASFGGSSAGENAYYINGFNTTDPLKNAGGLTLPYGSIDQEEVYTGGYSAMYGRSDGGVINMVGKRGTNEWHFGGQIQWQPEFAQATASDLYYTNGKGLYDPTSNSNYWMTTYDAYISGPIIKDKLFFFLSAEAQKQEGNTVNSVESTSPEVDYSYSMPKWYAKIDWNITNNNILEFTGASNKKKTSGSIYNYDYSAGQATTRKAYSDDTRTGGDLWSAKFTSYLTDNLTFDALYGKMSTENYDQPVGYDSSIVYISGSTYQNPAITGGTPITNSQTVSSVTDPNRGNKSSNLRLDLNYRIGNHSITAGIDNQRAEAIDQGGAYTSYWQYAYTDAPTVALSSGLGVGAPADYANGASGYYVVEHVTDGLVSVSVRQRAQFIEDKWQINDRWLASIGLRNDQYTDYNPDGVAYIKQTKPQLAPRLGFAWDVHGDSSLKVYGNAGRYYLAVPMQPALGAASGSLNTSQYYTYSGIDADGSPTGLTAMSDPVSSNNYFGQTPDPKTVTANNLEAEYQDEFILGFDKRLGSEWVFGSKATFRNLRNAVDDYCDVGKIKAAAEAAGFTDTSSNSCYLINPGRANTFTVVDQNGDYRQVTLSNDELGFPKLKRRYYGLDNYIEHPFDGKWYGKLSYTFSRSYGNTEGQERSDLRQFAASGSTDWDNSYVMEYSNGPQNNDHTHQIKFYGYYQFTPEWMMSASMQMISGAPRNCLGYYGTDHSDPGSYGSNYHYCDGKPSPPGSHGRYPWVNQLDLGASYSPDFADHKLAFTLNVFNVFNRQVVTNAYIKSEASPYSVYPLYNVPVYRQAPRYIRIGVQYDY